MDTKLAAVVIGSFIAMISAGMYWFYMGSRATCYADIDHRPEGCMELHANIWCVV